MKILYYFLDCKFCLIESVVVHITSTHHGQSGHNKQVEESGIKGRVQILVSAHLSQVFYCPTQYKHTFVLSPVTVGGSESFRMVATRVDYWWRLNWFL